LPAVLYGCETLLSHTMGWIQAKVGSPCNRPHGPRGRVEV